MNQNTPTQPVNRLYKSKIFAMLYSNKKELLELYNAISGRHYEDPELLEINTLENAIYMSMHNDVSFLIDSRLSLYEHQSTYSPKPAIVVFILHFRFVLRDDKRREFIWFENSSGFRPLSSLSFTTETKNSLIGAS